METIVVILLAIIAFILWRIYRQKEDEKSAIAIEKMQAEREREEKEKIKNYPNIYGKLKGHWLEVFSHMADRGAPQLKIQFNLMVSESVKIDYSDGSMKWDSLWDCSIELLEHLEKYHEGSILEHEIALSAYWQEAATAVGELIIENPNTGSLKSGTHTSAISGDKLQVSPFTDIEEIASFFPKKANHPQKEISFFDENGSFPRKSDGSALIDEKIRELGL